MVSDESSAYLLTDSLADDAARFESAPEGIRRILEKLIREKGLEPGDRIGLKSELQRGFRVSGPTIDTALKLLVNDGLVALRRGPKGGVFVARSQPVLRLGSKQIWARDARTLGENIELREALGSLVGVSAARAQDRDPHLLAQLVEVAETLAVSDISLATQRFIWRGHRILAELADSSTLRLIYLSLLDAAESLILEVEFPQAGIEATRERRRIDAHADLFKAVAEGDVELAREFGEVVRIVSPLGRDGHLVVVADVAPTDTAEDQPGSTVNRPIGLS
jgi:DNA-binding FadR family transcriptional regulator